LGVDVIQGIPSELLDKLRANIGEIVPGQCAWCGCASKRPYCSPLCTKALVCYALGGPMVAMLAWRTFSHTHSTGLEDRWITRQGRIWSQCQECRKFISWDPSVGAPRAWCTERCRKRSHGLAGMEKRRAYKLASPGVEHVRLTVVAVRDGWQCHLCGRAVKRKDASMDHLIPLSKGGAHTYQNVALAHRRCNSQRGAGRLPAQLRLS